MQPKKERATTLPQPPNALRVSRRAQHTILIEPSAAGASRLHALVRFCYHAPQL
jgi:hypothetical protein